MSALILPAPFRLLSNVVKVPDSARLEKNNTVTTTFPSFPYSKIGMGKTVTELPFLWGKLNNAFSVKKIWDNLSLQTKVNLAVMVFIAGRFLWKRYFPSKDEKIKVENNLMVKIYNPNSTCEEKRLVFLDHSTQTD